MSPIDTNSQIFVCSWCGSTTELFPCLRCGSWTESDDLIFSDRHGLVCCGLCDSEHLAEVQVSNEPDDKPYWCGCGWEALS